MGTEGALDALLGRLSTILIEEARLLGSVRGDVESIKEEMECMNSLLLDLTDAQHRNRQVRTWMKQVADLTHDCDRNVELYIGYVGGGSSGSKGFVALFRRIPQFLRTIPVRHRIATRIRELKVRARDIGERRMRYGVTVPTAVASGVTLLGHDDVQSSTRPTATEEEALRRRVLLNCSLLPDEDTISKGIDLVIQWLSEGEATSFAGYIRYLRVIQIKGTLAAQVARRVYDHCSAATSFDCMSWIKDRHPSSREILQEVTGLPQAGLTNWKDNVRELQGYLKGHIIRTTRLARRWTAEGLLSITESATVEGEHYLDVLATRGFVSPVEISAAGGIKRCTLHDEVHEFIARMARDVNFMGINLPPEMAHHLSIHNRLGSSASHTNSDSNDIVAFLSTLAASSQWQMMKVLDLEGCKGFKKDHLKSICKILLLKYLSLRNTDVTELPKQIKELQCLETLDIRQTKVRVLAKKAVVFPMLKHFHAGYKVSASTGSRGSEESTSAVRMPLGVRRMKNLELLSHVKVYNSDNELAGVAELLKLRKFGVVLHGKNAKLNGLFFQIEKLHRCLRSLSIRIDQPAPSENNDEAIVDALPSLPQFIENINISGITSGLPHLIQEHHQLAKITLSEAYLKEEDVRILGKLGGLRFLRLQHKSYIESELAFEETEFQILKFLLVEGSDITNISFAIGAAPKLERIVWSFAKMEALSGLDHLPNLYELELNGDCNLEPVKKALRRHHNHPVVKHNPQHQRQEDRTAAAASSVP